MPTVQDPTKSSGEFPSLPRSPQVPLNIFNQGLMSDTSNAHECFAYQRLSSRLQAYLVDYVNKVTGDFPIYH